MYVPRKMFHGGKGDRALACIEMKNKKSFGGVLQDLNKRSRLNNGLEKQKARMGRAFW
jgi:hypothetical protein